MKKLLAGIFIVSFLLATTAPAYAYLDGGTGSVLLQSLFAGVAGVVAVSRLYWYKVKLVVCRMLGKAPAANESAENDIP